MQDGKVYAHTKDKAFQSRLNLAKLEEVLPQYFVRSSKSCIINALQVGAISHNITGPSKVYFNGTFSQWKRVEVLANNLPLENIEFLIESVSWTFDENTGTLTVSGDVRMDDYNSSTEPLAPWHEHRAEIKKVVIENH